MTRLSTLFVLALVFALAACGPPRRQIVSAPVTMPTPPVQEEPPPEPEPVRMEGDTITIDQTILFAFDSAEILGDSASILDHLAAFIIAHAASIPSLEIIGHTDAQGTPRHNRELSQGRAESVAAALRQRGVEVALTPIGRGQSEPVCTESTDECHVRNRRVVFHIVR
jgi:outer membrane protein OmpA-like peptidoglycan-associated protein